MVDARRLAVAVVALLGLALAVMGAWLAVTLGPSGRVTFRASAAQPLVIGPATLNRVDVPVTVEARSAAGPVWIGTAVPRDVTDAVGAARHQVVVTAELPGRSLALASRGDGALADPRPLHVWRTTANGSLTVLQANAPEAVLVYPEAPGPVDVSVTWARSGWFLGSLVLLVTGLIVVAFAAGWILRRYRGERQPPPTASAEPESAEPPATRREVAP